MEHRKKLDNIHIVLVGTLAPGNIGSTARAMKNMGVTHLWLVNPQCAVTEEAYWMATNAQNILSNVHRVHTLREAIAPAGYVFGTTSRTRRMRTFISPKEMAQKSLSLAAHNQVAIVFGPEDKGLSNDQLELCNEVISIPTAQGGSSINLSQAVMILCYELYSVQNNATGYEEVHRAQADEVEKMYDHMRSALLKIGFLNKQNPEHTLGSFRRILNKAGLTSAEVNLIRGVFRQLLWYIRKTK
jgi:tRNA/rRNA methyltransferase